MVLISTITFLYTGGYKMNTKTIELWDGDVPGYTGGERPILTYYPTADKKGSGSVVICPGGGYCKRSPHEGKGYAQYLNSIGLDAFVLEYRVDPTRFPYPLLDARRAMRYVRKNATAYGISPDKIAIMGSSAGGHLAALTSTYKTAIDGEGTDELDTVDATPNAQILCYPVISYMGHKGSFIHLLDDKLEALRDSVTPSLIADNTTPPAYIWHTAEDASVNIINTYEYVKKLKELSVPVELHVYPFGAHGLGLANEGARTVPHVQSWAPLMESWLKLMGWIDQ